MKSKLYLTAILLFSIITTSFAQESHLISGKIYDSINSQPLVGASVKIKGAAKGAITGEDGTFQLKVTQTYPLL